MVKDLKFQSIKEIPLRNYFLREDYDFTPWIQENINLLGETIGIDIEDAEIEVPVGGYRLDVLAIESGGSRKIAIENQFETTDHSHLGQLLTYMAGAEAEIVVWIAENFKEEHITAINHLNQISNKDINFFCIRPRIIKIGESEPAIEFVIITKPDEWEKRIKSEIKLSNREIEYKKFWTTLLEKYNQKYPKYKYGRIISSRSNCVMSYGGPGIEFALRFKNNSLYITLYCKTISKPDPHELIDGIISRKSDIEDKLGLELEINKKDDVKSTFAEIKYGKETNILTISDKDKKDLIEWVIEWLPKFENILNPIVKKIQEESSTIL